MTARLLTDAEVDIIRSEIKLYGDIASFAQSRGVNRTSVSSWLTRKLPASEQVIKKLLNGSDPKTVQQVTQAHEEIDLIQQNLQFIPAFATWVSDVNRKLQYLEQEIKELKKGYKTDFDKRLEAIADAVNKARM